MVKIREIVSFIEKEFPPQVQESYDNSGLITGNVNNSITNILLTIDIDEAVIQEAIEKKCNLIIAHHPIIFRPVKSLTGRNYIERTIIAAIKNDIAIYAAHTSVDNSFNGLNKIICDDLGIKNLKIVDPMQDMLMKLVTFVPLDYTERVKKAIFDAGAGYIGEYDSCSFSVNGVGSFRAGETANPFVGEIGVAHNEAETRVETIFPSFLMSKVINALIGSHPYEEPAYDIYPLKNKFEKYGAGLIGDLDNYISESDFIKLLKEKLKLKVVKCSDFMNKKVKRVAVCTGAGHFLMNTVAAQKADVFISAEFKYNEYIEAREKLLIIDAGHFETEVFIKKLFYELLTKNFTNFAVEISENFNNPVNYL